MKAAKKVERHEKGLVCKYVRGLRVFAKDQDTTKFVDRDVNGSINIGLLWLSDNVSGRERPEVFKRRSPKKSAASQVASSHIPLKTAGEGRKRPYIKQNNGLVTVRVSHLVQ